MRILEWPGAARDLRHAPPRPAFWWRGGPPSIQKTGGRKQDWRDKGTNNKEDSTGANPRSFAPLAGPADFPCKAEFTVDEALASALRNETKVRNALDRYPLAFAHDDRLSQVRAALEDAQLARHSARLEELITSSEPELWGQIDKALGIAEQELEAARPQRADDVADWCKNHSWLAAGDEDSQCRLLAMIQRGLSVHSSGKCLLALIIISRVMVSGRLLGTLHCCQEFSPSRN